MKHRKTIRATGVVVFCFGVTIYLSIIVFDPRESEVDILTPIRAQLISARLPIATSRPDETHEDRFVRMKYEIDTMVLDASREGAQDVLFNYAEAAHARAKVARRLFIALSFIGVALSACGLMIVGLTPSSN